MPEEDRGTLYDMAHAAIQDWSISTAGTLEGTYGAAGVARALPDDEVHVWFAASDVFWNDDLARRFLMLLSTDELARNERAAVDADRRLYVAAHGLVRLILTEYAPAPPASWRFLSGPFGKPTAIDDAGRTPVQFSLSHTRGMVAIALTRSCPVGVDVEEMIDQPLDDLKRMVLGEHEAADLLAHLPEMHTRRFLEFWTLKEAYLKARGVGLQQPPGEIEFQLEPGKRPTIRCANANDDEPEAWHFWNAFSFSGHVAAAAVHCHSKDRMTLRVFRAIP